MNILFHFLFSFLFVDIVLGNAWDYLVIILIFSVLVDLTHLPYLFRVRKDVVKKRFGSGSRTRFHEIYGLTLFSAVICVLYLVVDPIIIGIISMCIVLHFAVDFLTGKSMPFYPYSRKEVFLRLSPYGYKEKILFETFLTVLAGVLFWLRVGSLVL